MGRPKGSKNKPKPLPPEVLAALEHARASGFVFGPEPEAEPRPKLPETFREFLRLVKIRGKRRGQLLELVPNEEQDELIDAWEDGGLGGLANLLVCKPRRIGITTIIAAIFFWEWLRAPDPIQIMHLANKKPVAVEIMTMHRTFLETLPAELRPKLTIDQATKIVREGGATIVVDTARGPDTIRGFGPYFLHISEFAFCRNPEELRAGAFGAVPTEEGGRIVGESTANYKGDVLHQEFIAAASGTAEVAWRPFFFPWFLHAKYCLPVPPSFVRTPEEQVLVDLHGVTDEQLVWRRGKLAQLGPAKFRREFPTSLEDAYSSTEGAWFSAAEVEHLSIVQIATTGTTILEPFAPGERYAFAGDCGAGTGGDFTTCIGLNVRTRRPVAIYRSNTDSPDASADVFWHLCLTYGNAMILVERNVWGVPHLNALRRLRANLYQEVDHEFDGQRQGTEPRDFVTTAKTRIEVLEAFRSEVLGGHLQVVDQVCWAELGAARVKDGDIVFPRSKEGHGDVLYGYALALRCARHVPLGAPPLPEPAARRAAAARQRVTASHVPRGRY